MVNLFITTTLKCCSLNLFFTLLKCSARKAYPLTHSVSEHEHEALSAVIVKPPSNMNTTACCKQGLSRSNTGLQKSPTVHTSSTVFCHVLTKAKFQDIAQSRESKYTEK